MNRPLDKDRLKRCIDSCYLTGVGTRCTNMLQDKIQ